MTPEQETLVIKRQELALVMQENVLFHTKILTLMYVLLLMIGMSIALILWLNRGTTQINGDKLDRIEKAIRETGDEPNGKP